MSYSYEEVMENKEAVLAKLQYERILKSYVNGDKLELAAQAQPRPVPNSHPPTWHLVVADMLARDNVGRNRYNTPLQPHNGRDSLQDAYEEALDLAVYLKNAIIERNTR